MNEEFWNRLTALLLIMLYLGAFPAALAVLLWGETAAWLVVWTSLFGLVAAIIFCFFATAFGLARRARRRRKRGEVAGKR